ncbi:hypothetical protein [Maridesulfovibrio sp. FT414]|uniref:hypothetical protein n=1 Tax=Maridesulfovibrio sp. FT414 TaxID=2979469 RepID=UPI003D8002A1
MKTFRVSCQGMDNAFRGNGSYDELELGEMNEDQLYDSFRKFMEAVMPEGDDVCPPGLYVAADGKDYIFYLDGTDIVCENIEAKLSPIEAVNLVSGVTDRKQVAEEAAAQSGSSGSRSGAKSLAWGTDYPGIQGMRPVRRFDLSPTDKDQHSRFNVNTSSEQPHVTLSVYKSEYTGGFAKGIYAFSILCFVLAVGLLAMRDSVGIAFVIVALVLAVAGFMLNRRWGRTLLRVGFDWAANALWMKLDSDKEAAMIENANCIKEFCVSAHDELRKSRISMDPSDHLNNPFSSMIRHSYTEKSFFILAVYSNNTSRIVHDFKNRKEADAACERLNSFLRHNG